MEKLILVAVIIFLSGCTYSRNTQEGFSLEKGAALTNAQEGLGLEMKLRKNHCDELFLLFGTDATEAVDFDVDVNTGKVEDISPLANESYRRCVDAVDQSRFSTPGLAIALSGGGTRSASYSMGILKALSEDNVLEHAELISSVSGGGYTAYWYYMQQYYQRVKGFPPGNYYTSLYDKLRKQKTPADVARICNDHNVSGAGINDAIFKTEFEKTLDQPYPFQSHVSHQSDILNYSQSGFVQKFETAGLATTHVASLPIYWVTDKLLNFSLFNGSVFTNAYNKGLQRTYALSPNTRFNPLVEYKRGEEIIDYHNGCRGTIFKYQENAQVTEIQFEELRNFLRFNNKCVDITGKGKPLPMPIINMKVENPRTVWGWFGDKQKLKGFDKTVYTMTPLAYGSGFLGYNYDAELHTPVPISKAYAISGAAVDGGARNTPWYVDFGIEVANANLGYKVRNPKTQRSWKGTSYFLASKAFVFPINDLIPGQYRSKIHLSDGGHAENLGAFSLIKRASKKMIIVDAEHDPEYQFEALNRLKGQLAYEFGLTLQCADINDGQVANCPLNASFTGEGNQQVFRMKVTGLYHVDGSPRNLDIMYVKLSVDKSKMNSCAESLSESISSGRYPCSVVNYYHIDREGDKGFPHNTTADIWYPKEQYQAYRDLAYYVAKTQLKQAMDNAGWDVTAFKTEFDNKKNFYDALFTTQ